MLFLLRAVLLKQLLLVPKKLILLVARKLLLAAQQAPAPKRRNLKALVLKRPFLQAPKRLVLLAAREPLPVAKRLSPQAPAPKRVRALARLLKAALRAKKESPPAAKNLQLLHLSSLASSSVMPIMNWWLCCRSLLCFAYRCLTWWATW